MRVRRGNRGAGYIPARAGEPPGPAAGGHGSEVHPRGDDIRPEYDFTKGVGGLRREAHNAGTNVVFLDSDVARVFTDSESVNRALRLLLDLANKQVRPKSK